MRQEWGGAGEVVTVRSSFTFRMTDRGNIRCSGPLAGGSLMDVGCYCVNLARRIAGCEPVRAQALERRTVDQAVRPARQSAQNK